VLDVRSAEELRPGLHPTADLSALGASARFAGGFAGGRGSWSFGGRRTYADAVQSIFTDDVFPYHFTDLQGPRRVRARQRRARVRHGVTAGRDVLDADLSTFEADSIVSKSNRGRWAFDWGNELLGVAIAKDLGERTTIEQRLSTSGFSTRLDLGSGASTQRSEVRDVRATGSLRVRGDVHDRSIGYEVMAQRVRHSSGSPQTETTEFDLTQRPITAALWLDDLWSLSSRWLLQGGLRGEALSGRSWMALSPRVSVKYFATPQLALTAGAGARHADDALARRRRRTALLRRLALERRVHPRRYRMALRGGRGASRRRRRLRTHRGLREAVRPSAGRGSVGGTRNGAATNFSRQQGQPSE
jgi:hypothetical protein